MGGLQHIDVEVVVSDDGAAGGGDADGAVLWPQPAQ